MKTFKTILLLISFGGILLSANSCRKIQEDIFIKGLWKMNGMYFDTLSENQMLNHFEGYGTTPNCCYYKFDFQPDNVVFGYYLKDNQFKNVVIGNWEIIKYNQILLQIDSFADGIFDIERTTPKKYKLSSENNHVKYFDGNPSIDTTVTLIELERI
jgi:hypothetical protein